MTSHRWSWLAAAGLALVFGLQVFLGSGNLSLTWDEPGYIASGYVNWTRGDYRLAPDHPPLMQKLQALPLLAMDVAAPPLSVLQWGVDPNPRATYGRAFFFASGNDPVRTARWARAPVMVLGMLLVLCVYGFARELMRPEAALLACALAAFDPNLIAHAKLATEDLGCAALMLAAVWTFWRWLRTPGPTSASICGAVTGLALLSKYTALLLLPIDAALAAIWWIQLRPEVGWESRAREVGLMAGLSALLINFAYGFGFHLDAWVAGISQIYTDVDPDYHFYFWGRVSQEPFWYYALASLVIKTPLSVWLLLGLAALSAVRSPRARRAAAVLAIPAGAVLFVSFFDITAPGVRRVLPAVPFVLLLGGLALEGIPGPVVRSAAWLAALASAGAALWIHPHHLSYINPLFGGPDNGPYVLDESNIDWGQDLPALAQWQAEHLPDEPLSLFYFGIADPAAYGVRAVPLETNEIEQPGPGTKAISAHMLAGFRMLEAVYGMDVDWLSKYEPIAKAGYSIFIYRFPDEVAPPTRTEPR
jgi:4-amino-4-deoxy-L-arabinose transferase-like glycosyltransferase